ncbi:selenium cofactor biosynthesis protein YqeC [Selenihalanaerobacter shriftii]|uniref:Probable selenium-dependent hydroxylase accessory protein YqeC n=1 Tax=Selenihalanaerobacter shriftii TaxID=142842 RepID=A0A1T4JTN8_9FIRM|nr:selenium cofactor biosynthesis protein YqeC [Selenihalanaerobacter shriftii]SJZ33474.1 probable selenium-dependent hydroxylase accessory protein YqeC [Selenihalanaerobacter shriftii]
MLTKVLEVEAGDIISLVGAGGKTSTMFRLAQELKQRSQDKIITTTTTKILKPSSTETEKLIIGRDLTVLIDKINREEASLVTIAKELTSNGKLSGIDPDWINRLTDLDTTIIVEADGAACKDFKIPNQQEPILPSKTDLLLPVIGSRIVGKDLTPQNLHRASLLRKINPQLHLGQPITVEIIVEILLNDSGYSLLNQQQNYRVIPLINQVDTPLRYDFALKMAKRLVKAGIEKVVLTAVKSKKPVVKVVKS